MVDLPTLHGPRNSTMGLEVISPSATARVRNRSELASVLTVGAALLPKALCTPTVFQLLGVPCGSSWAAVSDFLALREHSLKRHQEHLDLFQILGTSACTRRKSQAD